MNTRHSINGLVEILKWMVFQGYKKSELLRDTDINPARLSDPKATLSTSEELAFYQNLIDVSQDPLIMIKAGFNLKISAYGIWGLALLSSPTFGKAIELGIQYIDFTYTFNKITPLLDGQEAGLRISKFSSLGTLQEKMIERDIAAVFVLFQALLQEPYPLTAIRLAWLPECRAEDYARLFGCPVLFDCSFTEVRFPASLLDHPLPQHNALTVQLCTQQLEQIRPELQEGDSVIDQVNQYFLRTPLFRVNIDACASELNIGARQLRRRLIAGGASFQALLDEFRCLLADKYLQKTGMKLEEIAIRLGYSDAANFSHAYKRWRGVSPRQLKFDTK